MREVGNQVRTRRDWVALVAEHACSGLTQAAFCAQHGIYPANLRRARLKLEAQAERVPAALPGRFVRVIPSESVTRRPDTPLELAFGALTLRFAASTPPTVVAALVEALG